MRSISAGATGFGTHIPTSLMQPTGGGFSPSDNMTQVDTNGPACDGFQVAYGAGLASAGAFVPLLGAIGCPDIGQTLTLSVNGVKGGAPGLLLLSATSGALPLFGGTLLVGQPLVGQPLVGPLALSLNIRVGGTPGVAGSGSLALPIVFNSPSLLGVDLYLQTGFVDTAAVQWVSLSNGLRLQAG